MRTVLDNMIDGVSLFDKDLRLQFINQRLAEFQELPPERTLVGQSLYDTLRYLAKRGHYGAVTDVEAVVQERAALMLKPGGSGPADTA